MSFISIVAMEKYVNVMSDGLVINMETKEVLEENYKKFSLISKDQFIAFAGNKGVAEKVLEVVGYQEGYRDLNDLALSLRTDLMSVPFDQGKILIAVGGINSVGDVVVYSFNNNPEQQLLTLNPKGDNIAYTFLHNGNNDLQIEEKFVGYLRRYGYKTSKKSFMAQEALNNHVANQDDSVNKRTYKLRITT